jgi:hypothetical protein
MSEIWPLRIVLGRIWRRGGELEAKTFRRSIEMEIKPGSRWRSAVCTAEMVVVRPPGSAGELQCGGVAVLPQAEAGAPSGDVHSDHAGGVLIGKRYIDGQSGIEVLGAKAGKGSLAFDGRPLLLKEAKPLPASD